MMRVILAHVAVSFNIAMRLRQGNSAMQLAFCNLGCISARRIWRNVFVLEIHGVPGLCLH
tara:strand:- start:181 stop:360 length:180 start_codon:yes stop_codon:yes gene_type:complete